MNAKTPNTDSDERIRFLFKEYETLMTLRQDLISLGDRRFNFYVSIILGASVFLPWASSQQNMSELLVGVLIFGILLLGLTTFARMVQRNSSIILYSRGMNRIRRFFVDHHPEVRDYLIMESCDDSPSFKSVSFSEQLPVMLALINALVAGVLVSVVADKVLNWNLAFAVATWSLVFIVMLVVQVRYYNGKMRERVAGFEIRFPGEVA